MKSISEQKRIIQAATPGPWVADVNIYGTGKYVATATPLRIVNVLERDANLSSEQAMDNAMAIAHARTEWPDLIQWAEKARDVIARALSYCPSGPLPVKEIWGDELRQLLAELPE